MNKTVADITTAKGPLVSNWLIVVTYALLLVPSITLAVDDARLDFPHEPYADDVVDAGRLLYDELLVPTLAVLEAELGNEGLYLYPDKPRNEYRRFLADLSAKETYAEKLEFGRRQLRYLKMRFLRRKKTDKRPWVIEIFEQPIKPDTRSKLDESFIQDMHVWPEEDLNYSLAKGTDPEELDEMLTATGVEGFGYTMTSPSPVWLKVMLSSIALPTILGHEIGHCKIIDAIAHRKKSLAAIDDILAARHTPILGAPILFVLEEMELAYEQVRSTNRNDPAEVADAIWALSDQVFGAAEVLSALILINSPLTTDPGTFFINAMETTIKGKGAIEYFRALMGRLRIVHFIYGALALQQHFAHVLTQDSDLRTAARSILSLHRGYTLRSFDEGATEDEWINAIHAHFNIEPHVFSAIQDMRNNLKKMLGETDSTAIDRLISQGDR